MIRCCALSAALTLALPVAAQAPNPLPPAAQVRGVLDSIAQAFLAAGNTPGAAVAVVRGGDTLLFRGYGMANLETGTPVTVNTVFRIGSVTKQFTSAAVLQLVEEGKLALTDSIGQWLPDLPVAWRGVRITQLLNHTSGLRSYTSLGSSWQKRWGEEMTAKDLVQLTAGSPPDFEPGANWRYNNTGYVLLGMLVEARAGRAWGDDFAQRFFTPLGMPRTMYCENRLLIPGRATGYSRGTRTPWANASHLSMTQPHAAGALCSTIGDVLTWNRALHGGRVLKPGSYAAMTTPAGAAVKSRYGFGIGAEPFGGRTMYSHSGGINGFLTDNMYVPDADLSVTVLTNGDVTGPGKMARQLVRAALGLPLEPAMAPATTNASAPAPIASPAPLHDTAGVVRVAATLLRAISTKDTALARTVMLPGVRLVSVRDPAPPSAAPRTQSDVEFYGSLPRGTDALLERMWSPSVRFVGAALAEVSAPYDFHINGKFSHCGTDVFTVVRANGEWRLGALAYTVQREGCAPSPLGPPTP